jgi:Kef-type K+ transport system membrane component KefB
MIAPMRDEERTAVRDGNAATLAAGVDRRAVLTSAAALTFVVVGAVGVFSLISAHGVTLEAPPPLHDAPASLAAGGAGSNLLLRFLVALSAVLACGLVLGRLFEYIGQPRVIGEIVAGIALGPSLLGPELSAVVLPPAVAPALGVTAHIGVVLYMFIVGLELHSDVFRSRAPALVVVAQSGIVLPFLLGALLALYLYPRLATSDVPFTTFALFVGIALSVTAFPVLARILDDRGLVHTELGAIALSCAATADVTVWCLLALVVGIAKSAPGQALLVAAGTFAFVTLMLAVGRPLLRRIVARWGDDELPGSGVAFVLVLVLLAALATEAIGVHAIFGAFVLGAVIPAESAVARTFVRQFQPLITALLLPAFFAYTGMRTRIDLLDGWAAWATCGLIVAAATAGKLGGTMLAARATGSGWRESAALGTLMNTRGLMELIILNLGLEMGVIGPRLYSMMVVMALVTTMATGPLLAWLEPRARRQAPGSAPC